MTTFSFGGAPALASSLFGGATASSAPSLFGTPASTPSLFGAASTATSTPSLFGAPAATPSLFGASSAAASATPSLFGAPATGSLFGGAASAAASTPSLFGTPASTPSLFGAAPAAASTPSLFGAASTPSLFGAASTPSLFAPTASGAFGAAQPVQTSMFGSFGTQQQQQQQQQQALAAFGAPLQPDLAAVRELEALKDAFTGGPGHPRYRFACLLLNVVDDPAARVKPPGVDDLAWREALQRAGGADNPDRLWPVLAAGLSDLRAREAAQAAALEEHKSRLAAAATVVRELGQRREALLSGRLEAAKRREAQLGQQLLRSARQVDALEGRFAAAMNHTPAGARAAAADISNRLAALEKALNPSSAVGLPRRVAQLGERATARLESGAQQEREDGQLDEASTKALLGLLRQQQQSLSALEAVLQQDNRDLAIILDNDHEAAPMAIVPA